MNEMTKIYGIYDITDAVIVLKVGKATVKCEFSKGVVDGTDRHPAKLQTSNPIAQIAIENSPLFNNRIFLLETIGQPAVKRAEKPAEKQETKVAGKEEPKKEGDAAGTAEERTSEEKTEFPEVTTVGAAVVILKNKGIPATRLRNREAVFSAAKEAGLAFPNLPEQ